MKKMILSSLFLSLMIGCSTINKKSAPNGDKKLPPSLRNAEVKTLWIPDKIEADRYIEGHYIYIIEKPATWRAQ
ncbi:MAG: hypothetical protein JNM39_04855 [Bdellovibrionaceae bacterium]|nr:hypothetical protein [Pseudobdellovibrionaceae bacterium]